MQNIKNNANAILKTKSTLSRRSVNSKIEGLFTVHIKAVYKEKISL